MLEEGIHPRRLAAIIQSLFIPGTLVVAYNLQFDISFVHYLIKRYAPDFKFKPDCLDLLTVYKDTHDYPHRLEDALNHYAIPIENAHRAFADAQATGELLETMMHAFDIDIYINTIGYHQKYGLKGVTYPHINYHPQSYVQGKIRERLSRRY